MATTIESSQLPLIAALTLIAPVVSAVVLKIFDSIISKNSSKNNVAVKEVEQDTQIINSLVSRVGDLETKLNSLHEINRTLSEENSRLKTTLEFYDKAQIKLSEEVTTLKQMAAQHDSEKSQLLNKINLLASRMASVTTEDKL